MMRFGIHLYRGNDIGEGRRKIRNLGRRKTSRPKI